MNHIKFNWDNSYDINSAEELFEVTADRPDIIATSEEDGYHFRSEGDLQFLLNVMIKNDMDWHVLELSPGFVLSGIK